MSSELEAAKRRLFTARAMTIVVGVFAACELIYFLWIK